MSQTKAQLISDLVQALAFTATASAPTNGMFLSAANELAISTNSTQRLTVDSSGNVGIGTTSPSVLLHVSSSGDTIARVTSADGNSAFLDLGDASDPDGGRIVYDSGSNLTFSTGSTERLRITNAGKVGIGTSSIDERLHVEGSNTNERIKIENTTANIAGLVMLNTSRRYDVQVNGSDLQVFDSTGSTERLRIDSSGNVGIGKSSPDALLDAESASDQTVLRLRNNGGNNTKLLFSNKSAGLAEIFYQGDFRFVDDENSDAERLRIDSSGNVGIGTASPQHRLSVERDIGIYRASSDPTLSFSVGGTIDSPTKTYNLLIDDSDSDKLQLRDGSTARVTMDGSGKVGIGTSSPTSKLDVDGDVRIATGSAFLSNSSGGTVQIQGGATFPGGNILLGGGSGNDDIRFRTTGASQTSTERMRIDSSGRLLVGLSSNVDGSSTQINFSATLNRGSNATAANANIGVLKFADLRSNSAYGEIRCQSDGTPGTDDYPGRLTFSTTADGASSVTERMRIDSSGNLGVGDNDPPVRFSVTGSGDTHLGISSLHARIVDSSSFGTNVGGKLAFVGKINSSGTLAAFGAIHGGKEDNTNGANRGYLRFITRANGGDPSEAMRIDSGGNVGIGTTSPAALCHINKTSGTTLYRASVAGNSTIGLEIVKTGSTTQSWRIVDGQTVNGKLEFYDVTDSATRMCIDGSGKIGIGTTNPTADGLHIINSTQPDLFMGTSTNAEGFKIVYNNTDSVVGNVTNTPLRFVVNNSERMRIDSSGHMQIGTTSSDSFRLKVLNGAGTLARFTDGTSQTLDIRQASGGIELKNPNNGFISFNGSSSERVRISSDGQLLIAGTATGSNNCKLRVTGDEDQRFNSSSPPVRKRAISHTYTNLSTTATAMSQALISNACVVDVFLENIDADQAVFRFTSGRRQGSHHSYSLVSGSNSNCSVSLSTNVFTITGLGDGRTYTLTMSTGSITTAPTLKASSTATGTTRIAMYSVGAF